jgi:hypothetical protein
VFDRDEIIIVASAAEGFSDRGMVVAKAGGAPASCLLGEGRSVLPSPSRAVGNPSAESPIMVCCGDSGSPWAEPMTMVSELSHMGERLRPPKQSAMNSRLPKRMVSLREKSPHNKRSPPTAMATVDDGTSRTSRVKAHCKSSFLAHQLSVFFTPVRYTVVKIVCSYSKMVLRTIKNYKAHYILSWFKPLLKSNSPTSSGLIFKMNSGYNGGEQSAEEVC